MRNKKFDYSILVVVLILALFGILMVYSASYYQAQIAESTKTSGVLGMLSGISGLRKQVMGFAIGAVVMLGLSFLDYHWLQKKYVYYGLLLISVVFLVLVLGTKTETNGAKRWLDLKFVQFQPSEVARFAIVVLTAVFFSDKRILAQCRTVGSFFKMFWLPMVALGMVCGLILLGKNLSMTATVTLIFLAMVFAAGVQGKTIGVLSLGIGGLAAGFTVFESYRLRRLMIFLNPWKDPKKDGYQVIQSLYALGSGGLFGVGLGNSRQKYLFLTYADSDFILSIIGEELGFFGVILLLATFMFLIWRGCLVATRAKDRLGMLLAVGITSMVAIQLVIHVAVATSSMPPTGVPLPFISAGNTSLIMFMAAIGILLNISRQSGRAAPQEEA